jgi:hypothetical protein
MPYTGYAVRLYMDGEDIGAFSSATLDWHLPRKMRHTDHWRRRGLQSRHEPEPVGSRSQSARPKVRLRSGLLVQQHGARPHL